MNINKIAIPRDDEIFKYIPMEVLKQMSNQVLKSMHIIIYKPAIFIRDSRNY